MLGFRKKPNNNRAGNLPASLRDEQQKFKVIIDNIQDGVIMIDSEQTIQLINPAAAAICGWTQSEATGLQVQSVLQLVDEKGEILSKENNPLSRIFNAGQPLRLNNAFLLTRERKQMPVSLNLSPLTVNDEVTAAVAVFSNVSKERAEEKQRADFISTASHEMRTPVAAIEGYLALALNDKVSTIDNRAKDYLEKAHTSTQHLGKLFQDLLTSAKAEDGRLTSHPSVIEIGQFMQNLANDLKLVAEKKGLVMEFKTASGSIINATRDQGNEKVVQPLYYVLLDPDRFREVITNLFDNAVKYTPEGKITLGITGNDQVVQCYVKDTGPGIPEDDLPHLFQKFYRVDNSATRTVGGTGLGLFICRKIIELYNGRIWVKSKVGEGSSFYINLPRLTTAQVTKMQAAGGEQIKPAGEQVAA
jgi:PAS domain S-box-containing protein